MRIILALAVGSIVAAAPLAAPLAAPSGSKADSERLICKSETEVGSLVRRKRRCFSERDWVRVNEAARTSARRMQEEFQAQAPGQ